MAYDARAIANYFLDLAKRDGEPLNPMKLQKLIYYAHGISLAELDLPLIEERVEAWAYGPVVPSIYQEFKSCGSGAITVKATKIYLDQNRRSFRIVTPAIDDYPDAQANQKVKEILNTVWDTFGSLSGIQLSKLTHLPGTPWSETIKKYPGRKGVDISEDLMKHWFTEHFLSASDA